jgi:hypothetical protein
MLPMGSTGDDSMPYLKYFQSTSRSGRPVHHIQGLPVATDVPTAWSFSLDHRETIHRTRHRDSKARS